MDVCVCGREQPSSEYHHGRERVPTHCSKVVLLYISYFTSSFCHIPSFQCSQEICVCSRKAPVLENRERPDSEAHVEVKNGKTGGHLRVRTHYNERRDSRGRKHHIRRGSSGVSFSSQKVTFLLQEWGIQNVTSMSPCKYLISCRICWGCLTPRYPAYPLRFSPFARTFYEMAFSKR